MNKKLLFILAIWAGITTNAFSQVVLKDTVLEWQHHSFELNDDYSMSSYTSADDDITTVQFTQAKVIENNLIRLILLPEYGGRIISFVYKPTNHEYLYQSECGTPYGMNEGNFYYDWLMVYGGIFPTFPEPEHGKTWLLPWKFEVLNESEDTVKIAMEYTDTTEYASAPGKFNNGTTGITCVVEVAVYKGASVWDFNVSLTNNKSEAVNYEYWTCTTLTPGSEQGNTGSPLSTEMVVPIEYYIAGWSPGSWIGGNGSVQDFSRINNFSKWTDMGIAYANNLSANYWGVINHDNEEGIFRICENDITTGLKFWTWGKNNIDNNMFDFSNGGADNYIELWAGVSQQFFSDAMLNANSTIAWNESYAPTVQLASVDAMNKNGAVTLAWEKDNKQLTYNFMGFYPGKEYTCEVTLEGETTETVQSELLMAAETAVSQTVSLTGVAPGSYSAVFSLLNAFDEELLTAQKQIEITTTGNPEMEMQPVKWVVQNQQIKLDFGQPFSGEVLIYSTNGQLVKKSAVYGQNFETNLPYKGLYIVVIQNSNTQISKKILIK